MIDDRTRRPTATNSSPKKLIAFRLVEISGIIVQSIPLDETKGMVGKYGPKEGPAASATKRLFPYATERNSPATLTRRVAQFVPSFEVKTVPRAPTPIN